MDARHLNTAVPRKSISKFARKLKRWMSSYGLFDGRIGWACVAAEEGIVSGARTLGGKEEATLGLVQTFDGPNPSPTISYVRDFLLPSAETHSPTGTTHDIRFLPRTYRVYVSNPRDEARQDIQYEQRKPVRCRIKDAPCPPCHLKTAVSGLSTSV
ncbi:hypothetical protein K439DRAFT_545403 [Ramaria rubella]|nr:hypothetical protein K439DRAFT_545403 [Ramaria rubella]